MKKVFKEIEKAVYENKLFYKQRFIDLEDRIDLNTITEILNNYEIMNSFKTAIPINPNDVFSYTFQMKGVEKHPTIWNLHNLMKNNISSCDIDRTDLFAAFKKSNGPNHVDHENSLILSVYNNTIYYFPDDGTTIVLEPGDLLLVPTGRIHSACNYQARIVLSWGLYKK